MTGHYFGKYLVLYCAIFLCSNFVVVSQKSHETKKKTSDTVDISDNEVSSHDSNDFSRVELFTNEDSSDAEVEDSERSSPFDESELQERMVSLTDLLRLSFKKDDPVKEATYSDTEDLMNDVPVEDDSFEPKEEPKPKYHPWDLFLSLPFQYPEKEVIWSDTDNFFMPSISNELSDKVKSRQEYNEEPSHQVAKGKV